MVEEGFDLLDQAPIGMFVLREDFVVLFWNRCLEDWTGISRSEVIGKNIGILFPHLSDPRYTGRLQSVFESGPPVIFSSQLHKYIIPAPLWDGRLRVQHTTVTSVPASDGAGFHALFSIQDVTDLTHRVQEYRAMRDQALEEAKERKRAEEALKEYSERLEEIVEERTQELRRAHEELIRKERLAILGQLSGGVAHELRNPLGAISNAAYFLNLALEDPDPEIKETLDILKNEVRTSDKIISSLLDVARAKPPVWREIDVNDVVRAALSRTAVPESIQVVSQLDEALPIILADPDQLSQVFGNIIINGIQAMPEGGRLVVKTLASSDFSELSRAVEPSEAPEPEWVAVSIADTGAGIPEENLEQIFEPLFTTKPKGIGLGLAIVKTMVEGHGGAIEVESEVGKGSTFTVRLPLAKV